MAFLRINGITVPCRDGTVSKSPSAWGKHGPSFLNRPIKKRRKRIRSWSASTPPIDAETADSFEGLLEGRGHHFSFDGANAGAWSDAGLGPESGSTYTIGAPGKIGSGKLVITVNVVWNANLIDNKSTVLYWRSDDAGATWEHIVVRSDGAKWADGVRADATATAELTVSNGAVAFTNAYEIDDLVILPFVLAETHAEQFYVWSNAGALPFSPLPRLTVDGDFLGAGRETTVLGNVTDEGYFEGSMVPQGAVVASWQNNLRVIQFTMEEI